ncbi:MAG TPA: 30S ribosomal protein S2 [Acidimicrobiia bacterium]|jgi:small subunit ribosomal protein S2
MAVVTMRQLLDAGVHFGHQTRRWNPKMKRFLFGERSGIYIVDLHQTLGGIEESYKFVRETVASGGTVLFVGTKKQAQEPIARHAASCNMPYVNFRWLGGMLTNFQTVHGRTSKLRELQRVIDTGEVDQMIKKEGLKLRREATKLERNLGGIKNLERLPSAVFVIDTKKEHIAVTEANRLGIPVVAVVDTNCDPDVIQYVIPGNDDAIRSANLMCRVMADAVKEGRQIGAKRNARQGGDDSGSASAAPAAPARPVRTAEQEAEFQARQQAARDAAASQQREIERRAAQAKEAAAAAGGAEAAEGAEPAGGGTTTATIDPPAADAGDTTSTNDTTSEGTDNG